MKDDQYSLYDEFVEGLQIDKFSLDEMLVRQPELFFQVSEKFAISLSKRDQAKSNIAEIEAKTELDIRAHYIKSGEKITEATVKSVMRIDEDVVNAHNEYIKLKEDAAKWESLKDSFSQRSYILRDIAQLFLSNYYTNNEVKEGAAGQVSYEDNRKKIARSRLKDRNEKKKSKKKKKKKKIKKEE